MLAMFKAENMFVAAPCSVTVPRPDPEPNPEPDSAVTAPHSDLSAADWDELFHAVVARLQACTGLDPKARQPEHLLGVTASLQVTVQECVTSLNWLHAALPRDR